ncbi:MAG TPA: LpqB family beta-propeller domain-containing protein, partial [Vicinamibacterales bacterium]|nr:LpqB family beta-propeller domain-containing protein [Vicinamibacterales bacterium]
MTSRLIAAGAFGLALWTLSSVSTSGQAKRPMTLVDLAELPRIVNPQLSPNGQSIIYQQSHADWKADRPVWNTWRRDLGGSATQLTFSEGGDINPPGCLRWSPDGKTILFVRSSPAPQIWLLPADGGEPSALTRHSTGVYPATPPMWAPDSKSIYFVAEEPRTAAERDRDAARDDVFAFEENYRQRHIWNVVVSTGAERQITSGDFNVNTYRLSHDGSRIAFERAPSPLIADKPRAEV